MPLDVNDTGEAKAAATEEAGEKATATEDTGEAKAAAIEDANSTQQTVEAGQARITIETQKVSTEPAPNPDTQRDMLRGFRNTVSYYLSRNPENKIRRESIERTILSEQLLGRYIGLYHE